MNVWIQFGVPGLAAIAAALITSWFNAFTAARNSNAAVEVKKLDIGHEDQRDVTKRWMDCVEQRATCEAERAALERENADLLKERARLTEELGNARQRLAYVEYFDEQGKLKPAKLKEFAEKMMAERPNEI